MQGALNNNHEAVVNSNQYMAKVNGIQSSPQESSSNEN
jgi:RecA/RadA recombinase